MEVNQAYVIIDECHYIDNDSTGKAIPKITLMIKLANGFIYNFTFDYDKNFEKNRTKLILEAVKKKTDSRI